MTLPWIAGSAAVGVLAGPPVRVGVLRSLIAAALVGLTHLGMPGFRPAVGRSSGAGGGP
jgi:hypothetical protein